MCAHTRVPAAVQAVHRAACTHTAQVSVRTPVGEQGLMQPLCHVLGFDSPCPQAAAVQAGLSLAAWGPWAGVPGGRGAGSCKQEAVGRERGRCCLVTDTILKAVYRPSHLNPTVPPWAGAWDPRAPP